MAGYASVVVAGVTIDNCKILVVDGANLRSPVTGSIQYAADGSPQVQYMTPVGGRAIGLQAEFIETAKLNQVIDAVNTAAAAGEPFQVTAVDDIHDFDEQCVPDFGVGWLQYQPQRTHPDTIKSVTFRFITSE